MTKIIKIEWKSCENYIKFDKIVLSNPNFLNDCENRPEFKKSAKVDKIIKNVKETCQNFLRIVEFLWK